MAAGVFFRNLAKDERDVRFKEVDFNMNCAK
jgi:hypothetical protein